MRAPCVLACAMRSLAIVITIVQSLLFFFFFSISYLDLTRAYSSKNKIVEILGMPIANDLGAKDILENDIEACDDVICNTVIV